ncbi:MAG: Vps62-related protein [Thermoplasmatales archaeon]|nr:MAG: Vps62-related protein [Thermoplasmatales archaeon]
MKYKIVFIIAIFVVSLLFGNFVEIADAADEDIAQQYAPTFYFEKDEKSFPVDISYHIENSYLYEVDSDNYETSPTAESIAMNTSENHYLDNQIGSVGDDNIINDYQSKMNTIGYTVYVRVYPTGARTIIQYWMFYAFNKGTQNQHEGDWEMVQVVLAAGTPTHVMYSQHHGGQKATWDQVEKNGDSINVYVSRGSHANYLRSYSGVVGVANDLVGDNGKIITLTDYNLVMLTNQSWLNFAGRWGEYGTTEDKAAEAALLGQAGPNGPMFREDGAMWSDPLGWGDGLVQADNNIFILELILYNFVIIFIILTIVILCVLLFRIYRRHKKTGLGPRILSMLYIDGLNAKSIGNILCIVGIIIAIFSLINPWYEISTDIGISGYETHGMANMMTIDGINGIQVQVPGLTGTIPMGSFTVPFSLLIAISLLFLIIASIGVAHSKNLGKKYVYRGIRLFIPIILIVIIILALSAIPFESFADTGDASIDIGEVIGAISGSPFVGQQIVSIPEVEGQVELQWGFSLGGYLLIISGIILIISGLLEFNANTSFFESKIIEKKRKEIKDKSEKPEEKPKLEELVTEEDKKRKEK